VNVAKTITTATPTTIKEIATHVKTLTVKRTMVNMATAATTLKKQMATTQVTRKFDECLWRLQQICCRMGVTIGVMLKK
jgi:hypothetical protein